MNPRNKSDVSLVLSRLWSGKPEAVLGLAIVDYLATHINSTHIPFSRFFSIASENNISDAAIVLNIVNYLTGAHLNLLVAEFEYIENDVVIQLESDEVKNAKISKINPYTGEFDECIGEKIFMYFLPSNLAKEALVNK